MTPYPVEMIQSLPIPMLTQWANPAYRPNDDLALMQDIMLNGIQDPIEIGIGIWSRKVRLNTGNHRIYLAPRLGLTQLPVIARVWNYCAFDNGNGDHAFPCSHITVKKEWIQDEYWSAPSDVLDVFELMKEMPF